MPPQQPCLQPYYWPPDSITASYMAFHLDRSKVLLGRMRKLHQKASASHPRMPAKKKRKHRQPEDYMRANSSFFSPSCRQLMIAMQKHRPGLSFPAFNATGVVYAIFFMAMGSQQISGHYVGISQRSVAERFEEHVRQAKDYKQGLRIMDGDASKLYNVMAARGIANCFIVPLQVIPGVEAVHNQTFLDAARRYERDWIRILDARDSGFNSYIPGGKGVSFSAYLESFTGNLVILWNAVGALYRSRHSNIGGYPFHYRDYVRRFQALHERRGMVGSQSQTAVMAHMRRRNIERMIAVATLHSIQDIFPQDQSDLVGLLATHLESRVQNRHRKGKSATRMFVPAFMSVLLDDLPLQKILASQAATSLLPVQMRHVHIMLGFGYSRPIGRQWFNYGRFFTDHNTQQLHDIASGPCSCHLPQYAHFKLPGCEHVTTCSPDFLRQEFPHLPALADIWTRGAKYRPHTYPQDCQEHRADIMAELSDTVSKLRARLSRQFSVPEYCLDPWCSHVLSEFSANLSHLPQPSLAPLGPSQAPVYGPQEKAAMKSLLSRYICMVV